MSGFPLLKVPFPRNGNLFLNPLLSMFLRGKQEFRRTDFGSRLLAAESEGGGWGCEGEGGEDR